MNQLLGVFLLMWGIPIVLIFLQDYYQLTAREAGLSYAVMFLLVLLKMATDDKDRQ
jgi:hypothetical protein